MNELKAIVKDGQRVLTTQQLAEVYETDIKNISNNFNRNYERFVFGKHYFRLEGQELKDFKNGLSLEASEDIKFASTLYIWTGLGALLHHSMCSYATENELNKIIDYFNFDTDKLIVIYPFRKECEFGKRLMEVFNDVLKIDTQKTVGIYRLDFYIEKYNIAIEFDEKYHKYNKENDINRQTEIEEMLGCKFIRIKENEKFEISLNRIMKELL